MHPTSVTSIVDRLEAAGLVVRRRHPEDGRGVLAEITDSGRALVERATAELVRRLRPRGLDDDGLRDLSALLRPGSRPATSEGSPAMYRCADDRPRPRARCPARTRCRCAGSVLREERGGSGEGALVGRNGRSSLPSKGDLRFQWVCARPALGDDEMRELVSTPGGCACRRCCTTARPEPAARVWDLVDQQEGEVPLHPYLHFQDRATSCAGDLRLHLADHPTPRPPRWRSATGSCTGDCRLGRPTIRTWTHANAGRTGTRSLRCATPTSRRCRRWRSSRRTAPRTPSGRASSRSRAGSTRPATAGGPGRSASSPGSATPSRPTSATG